MFSHKALGYDLAISPSPAYQTRPWTYPEGPTSSPIHNPSLSALVGHRGRTNPAARFRSKEQVVAMRQWDFDVVCKLNSSHLMTSHCPHLAFYLSILVTLLASSTCRLLYVRQGKAPLVDDRPICPSGNRSTMQ